jgi:hypothetical protein
MARLAAGPSRSLDEGVGRRSSSAEPARSSSAEPSRSSGAEYIESRERYSNSRYRKVPRWKYVLVLPLP